MSRAGVARLAAVLAWVVATSALAAFGGKTFDAPLCVRQDGVLIGCRPFLDLSGATCTDTPLLAEVACTVTGAGPGGSPIAVDLGANGSNETAALAKITTTNDLVTPIFSVSGTTLNFDVGKKWPACTAADTATTAASATTASGLTCTDCVALTTETTGNYVASVACTAPLTGCVAAAEGAAPTLTVSDATTIAKGVVQLAGDLAGTAALPTIAADAVALGTDTTGNYVASVACTAPVTGCVAGAEGAAPTIAVSDATTLAKGVVQLAGDLAGTAALPTIAPDAVALGTDTTGNYVADVAQGTGITVSGAAGEGATKTVALTTPVSLGNGGTGQTTAAAAFDALAPTTTRGDLIARGASSNTRLGLGGANLYPKSNGTDVVYSTLAAGGVGSCTNQFVRTLNADATPTCNSVAATDFASSTDPFGGLYTKLAGRSGSGNDTLLSTSTTGKLWGSHTTGQGITILPNDVDATGDISLDGESILRPAWPDPAGTTSYLQRFTRTQTVTGSGPQLYGYDFAPTLTWSATGLCTGGTGSCTGAGNANQGAGCACTANANCNSGDCRGTGTMAVFHQGGTYTLTGANPSNIQFQSALRADYTVKSSTANVGPWMPDTILELWSSQMDGATATSPTQYIATHLSWIPSITAINGGKYYMGAVSCASDPTSGMAAIYGGGTVSSAGSGGDICVPRRSLVWDIGSNVSTASGSTATLVKDSTVYSKDRTKWANTTALSVVDSDLTAAAGKYDLHLVGGAQNVIAGNVRIGSTSDPTNALDVTGAATASTSLQTPIVLGGTATSATLTLESSSSGTPTGASTIYLQPQTRTLPNPGVLVPTAVLSDNATLTFGGTGSLYTALSIGGVTGSNVLTHATWTAPSGLGGFGGGVLLLFTPKVTHTVGVGADLGSWQLFQAPVQFDCNGGGSNTACTVGDNSAITWQPNYTSTASGTLTASKDYGIVQKTTVGSGSTITLAAAAVSAPVNSGTITTRYGVDLQAAGGVNPTQIGLNVGALTTTSGLVEASAVHSAIANASGNWLLAATGAADSSIAGKLISGPASLTVPSAQIHAQAQTLGNEELRAEAVGTGSNPNWKVYHAQGAPTASATTNIDFNLSTAACPSGTTCTVDATTTCHCISGSSCTAHDGAGQETKAVFKNNGGTIATVGTLTSGNALATQISASSVTSITSSLSAPNLRTAVVVPASFNHRCTVTILVSTAGS